MLPSRRNRTSSRKDWLARHFGQSNIFYDTDTIPVGVDWLQYLNSSISKCAVLLAPIGDRWLEELTRISHSSHADGELKSNFES